MQNGTRLRNVRFICNLGHLQKRGADDFFITSNKINQQAFISDPFLKIVVVMPVAFIPTN